MSPAVGFQIFIREFCSSLPPTRSKLPLRLSWYWEMRPLGFSGGFQCNSTVVELMIMCRSVTQTPGKNDTMSFYCEDKIHASWNGTAPSTSQLALICGLKQSHCGRNKHAFPVLWGRNKSPSTELLFLWLYFWMSHHWLWEVSVARAVIQWRVEEETWAFETLVLFGLCGRKHNQVFIGIIPVSELECLLPSCTAGYARSFSLEYFLTPLPRLSRFFNCLCKHWGVLESQALPVGILFSPHHILFSLCPPPKLSWWPLLLTFAEGSPRHIWH